MKTDFTATQMEKFNQEYRIIEERRNVTEVSFANFTHKEQLFHDDGEIYDDALIDMDWQSDETYYDDVETSWHIRDRRYDDIVLKDVTTEQIVDFIASLEVQ